MNRHIWLEHYRDGFPAAALVADAACILHEGGEIAQTREFHEAVLDEYLAAGFELPALYKRLILAANLIQEESGELLHELDVLSLSQPTNKAEIAKEAADLIFVVLNLMFVLDIPFEGVYAEVLRSNWSKLDGTMRFREDGKLLKSETYSPADIEGVLSAKQEA